MFVPFTFTEDIPPADYGLFVPMRQNGKEDAAFDLRARKDYVLTAGDCELVPTGIRVAIPEGYAGLVLPRSGLALTHGISVVNSPGLIDPGYRGEISVILQLTWGAEATLAMIQDFEIPYYRIERGERIAQLLIIQTAEPALSNLSYLPHAAFDTNYCDTKRGEGGFGSTGR